MNKILIIDDDKELCVLIKRSVLSEDIEADFCNTGKEGLQKLKEKEYQLVILDVMMPGMDGFETMKEIRKENSLPILMFTSKNDNASKVCGLRAGADDYLFFMERDNDTFKNLRTIPVTSTQMVLAKIFVLFLFGIIFCVASTIATILCGFGTLEVYGLGYKLFLAIETGIFITAGTLPLIVLVVFFSKTYVFSILLCVFYSVLNMSATALFDALPKTILWFLPTPLTTFWSAGDMAAHGIKMDLEQMTGLIPSTFQVVMILGIMAIISFGLIDRLYKQRGE